MQNLRPLAKKWLSYGNWYERGHLCIIYLNLIISWPKVHSSTGDLVTGTDTEIGTKY